MKKGFSRTLFPKLFIWKRGFLFVHGIRKPAGFFLPAGFVSFILTFLWRAVSADWPEGKKLRIKVQIIDKYFGNLSMEFGFKEDRVGIYMIKNAEAFLGEYEGYANGRLYV